MIVGSLSSFFFWGQAKRRETLSPHNMATVHSLWKANQGLTQTLLQTGVSQHQLDRALFLCGVCPQCFAFRDKCVCKRICPSPLLENFSSSGSSSSSGESEGDEDCVAEFETPRSPNLTQTSSASSFSCSSSSSSTVLTRSSTVSSSPVSRNHPSTTPHSSQFGSYSNPSRISPQESREPEDGSLGDDESQ